MSAERPSVSVPFQPSNRVKTKRPPNYLYYCRASQLYIKFSKSFKIECGETHHTVSWWMTRLPSHLSYRMDTCRIGFYGTSADRLLNYHFFTKKAAVLNVGFNEEIADPFKRAIKPVQKKHIEFRQILSGIIIYRHPSQMEATAKYNKRPTCRFSIFSVINSMKAICGDDIIGKAIWTAQKICLPPIPRGCRPGKNINRLAK